MTDLPEIDLPKLDLASLPGLDAVTGLFGSVSSAASGAVDDRAVVVMTYLFEMARPDSLI